MVKTKFIAIIQNCVAKLLRSNTARKSKTVAVLVFVIIALIYHLHSHNISLEDSSFYSYDDQDDDRKNTTKSFVVSTPTCRIPDFLPWSKDSRLLQNKCRKYFRGEPKCEENPSWAHIDGQKLVVNLSAVHDSGYSWNSIRCCYRIIYRVEQSYERYDMNADRNIRYSDSCHKINNPKQSVDGEFIRVFCISTTFPTFGSVVSRQFLAIVKPDERAREKIEKWNSISNEELPPSVLLLGIDTMSRLNAYRTLNQTLAYLRSIGAVEMLGYTKVGESTFPNTVAFMSGYTLGQIRKFCYQTTAVAQDFCPYVWKAFDKAGYLTATVEDAPYGTSFNFLKAGFVKKPVDFFFRPLMLAVMKHQPRENSWYVRCIGNSKIEEVILRYNSDIITLTSSNAPVFIHTWSTVLSHECSNAAKYGDSTYANFLEGLNKENMIILFMSDHGDIYGDFRETVQGWYEDKLPTVWIYLPAKLRSRFPQWLESLQVNSKRLTSPFDMYKTLVHILRTFDKDKETKETHEKLPTQFGQSLFEIVPENRTCQDAGIPEGYCACSEPRHVDISDTKVQKAASKAFSYITDMLPKECANPVMTEIMKAKVFETPSETTVYIISFSTDPGHFVFESTVREGKDGRFEVTNDVLRMNKIVRKADCVDTPLLERYCYCK